MIKPAQPANVLHFAHQACSSEFLSFVASEARARVLKEGRTAVTDADMLWALDRLGMKSALLAAVTMHVAPLYLLCADQ